MIFSFLRGFAAPLGLVGLFCFECRTHRILSCRINDFASKNLGCPFRYFALSDLFAIGYGDRLCGAIDDGVCPGASTIAEASHGVGLADFELLHDDDPLSYLLVLKHIVLR